MPVDSRLKAEKFHLRTTSVAPSGLASKAADLIPA
jgi:hypothetical protein